MLLSVNQMRTASVVRLSFLYYALGLLVLYFLVSAYMIVFAEYQEKQDPSIVGGIAPDSFAQAMGDTGLVFLAVALAVVGIGPNIPVVRNVEAWLRRSAHGLAGIPTRVLEHTIELRGADFKLTKEDIDLLLLPEDRLSVEKIQKGDPELLRDVALIAGPGAWVLNTRSIVVESRLHDPFRRLEDELRRRKNDLFRHLRDEADKSDSPKSPGSPISAKAEADELADDICVLLALYHEHGLLVGPRKRSDWKLQGDSRSDRRLSVNPDRRRIISDFVGTSDTLFEDQTARRAMLAMSWTLGVIAVLSAAWTIWPGALEQQIRYPDDWELANLNWWRRWLERLSSGLFTVFLPVAFGVSLWQGAESSSLWGDGLGGDWTHAVPRGFLIFAGGWAIGIVFQCGLSLWLTWISAGWTPPIEDWMKSLGEIFEYQAPRVVHGALLAVLVVGVLDRWKKEPGRAPWVHTLLGALMVGVTDGLMRLQAILTLIVSEASWPTEYRAGSIVYVTLYSTLLSLFILYGISRRLSVRHVPEGFKQGKEDVRKTPKAEGALKKSSMTKAVLVLGTYFLFHRFFNVLRTRSVKKKSNIKDDNPASNVTGAIVLMIVLCAVPTVLAAQDTKIIKVGVRTDARPYIWVERKDPVTGEPFPKGYLGDVCAFLVASSGHIPEFVEVDLAKRTEFLTGRTSDIDLLCDPTTVTLKRLADFTSFNMRFSSIFHLANRGYLERNPSKQEDPDWEKWWERCRDFPSSCVRLSLQKTPGSVTEPLLHVAVAGTTSGDALSITVDCIEKDKFRCFFKPSHQDAAAVFCKSEKRIRYHGDVELIEAAVKHWNNTERASGANGSCDYKRSSELYGYEPYAFAISGRVPDLDQRLSLQLYEMAHDGRLGTLLRTHFPCATISPDLISLLRILSVPAGTDPARPEALSNHPVVITALPDASATRCSDIEGQEKK